VVFDESVFPFSNTSTTTPVPDPSSLFPADMVVQPPFSWSPAGTASPRSLPGTCPGSPAGPDPLSSGAAPTSPFGADPGTSSPDTAPGGPCRSSSPGAAPAPPSRFVAPVRVYQRRPRPPPLAVPSPPRTPTPPPQSPPARDAPPVYHLPLLHRHPRHVHSMVTRHTAGTLPPRALAASTGDAPCWIITGAARWKRSTPRFSPTRRGSWCPGHRAPTSSPASGSGPTSVGLMALSSATGSLGSLGLHSAPWGRL
jgi:hypothetical protein